MNYNDVIGVLKAWCREKGDRYHEYYRKAGGETYIKYLVTGELQFHLSMLMAREFSSPEDFLEQVKASYWHFYDISQCCEMECFNYHVVVARQNEVWCLHEQKWNKDIAEEYYKAREKFMEKYKSFI